MVINKKLTPYNFNDSNRGADQIDFIVIHYVGALGGAEANCNYYASKYIGASAHFFVGFSGEIWQCVEESDTAWHCGASSYKHPTCRNSNSIGIELCVRKKNTGSLGATDKDWYFEDATVKAAVELTKYLMKKYNIPAENVIRHYDVTGKICPNPYVYNTTSHTWSEFKNLISDGSSPSVPSSGGSTGIYKTGLYKVNVSELNIRKGASTNYDVCGKITDKGTYTITEIQNTSWGKLKSGAGWINVSTSYCSYVGAASDTGSSGDGQTSSSESEFVKKVGELAKKDMEKSGILASVTTAQAILESGYGSTELAKNANNLFGMKCSLSGNTWAGSTWDGTSKYTKETKEQKSDGTEYTVTADFRKYTSIEDSVNDHSAYLNGAMNGTKLRYNGLKGEKDYKKAIQIIKDGGYATDVSYVDKICSIIERWNLTQYDSSNASSSTDTTIKYRVRKTWADESSQKGAFNVLANAQACADANPGYYVFDTTGKAIYPTNSSNGLVAKSGYITSKVNGLNIHSTPEWGNQNVCDTINNDGKYYTVVGEITVDDGKMYKLKSGVYVTSHEKYVNFTTEPPTSTVKTLGYTTGEYVLSTTMKVRTGPSTSYRQKAKSELTADGKKHANANGCLLAGTHVTALEISQNSSEAWMRGPSGWICIQNSDGVYARKV